MLDNMTMLNNAVALIKYEPKKPEEGSFHVSENTVNVYEVHSNCIVYYDAGDSITYKQGQLVSLMPDSEIGQVAVGSDKVLIVKGESIAAALATPQTEGDEFL